MSSCVYCSELGRNLCDDCLVIDRVAWHRVGLVFDRRTVDTCRGLYAMTGLYALRLVTLYRETGLLPHTNQDRERFRTDERPTLPGHPLPYTWRTLDNRLDHLVLMRHEHGGFAVLSQPYNPRTGLGFGIPNEAPYGRGTRAELFLSPLASANLRRWQDNRRNDPETATVAVSTTKKEN